MMGREAMDNTRNELIRQILDVFDTVDNLRFDNRLLRGRLEAFERGVPSEVEMIGFMDEQVLKFGREVLVERVLRYWRDVKYDVDDDTGDVSVQSYEKWLDAVVDSAKIPSWCSRDGFYDYFDAELRTIYESECEKAVAEAHNER